MKAPKCLQNCGLFMRYVGPYMVGQTTALLAEYRCARGHRAILTLPWDTVSDSVIGPSMAVELRTVDA